MPTALPEPEPVTTPPRSLLIYRFHRPLTEDDVAAVAATAPVAAVLVDDTVDVAVQYEEEAEEALAGALTEAAIAEVPDAELSSAVLEHLAEVGWRLVRLGR